MSLRSKLIKLAHEQPELRAHILPLVTKTAGASATAEVRRQLLGILAAHRKQLDMLKAGLFTTLEQTYGDIPVVQRFMFNTLSLDELERAIKNPRTPLMSLERLMEIYRDGIIDIKELSNELETYYGDMRSVRMFLEGVIDVNELDRVVGR
jgi:hypothetical protein